MQRKIPQRRCTGCGERMAKGELVRVVREPDGAISLDRTGKKNGRGAYLCPKKDCLKKARKARRLERNLETAIPDEIYEALEKSFED